MTRLARDHDDLTTMMRFVGHEIGQHVSDVERKILPDVTS